METEKSIFDFDPKAEREQLIEFIKTQSFQTILMDHAAIKNFIFYHQLTQMHHEYFDQSKEMAAEQLADDLRLENELSDYIETKKLDVPEQFAILKEERIYIGAEASRYRPTWQMEQYGRSIFESLLKTSKSQNDTINQLMQMLKV